MLHRLVGHFAEECWGGATLRHDAIALLDGLSSRLTIPAPDGKRESPKARVGDLVAAVETVAVAALLKPAKRRVDLFERLRLHLDQRELDFVLDIDFRTFALVEHTAIVGTVVPHVAHFAVNCVPQVTSTILEGPGELANTAFLYGYVRLRFHDACRSLVAGGADVRRLRTLSHGALNVRRKSLSPTLR
jgi:hypothetical protein